MEKAGKRGKIPQSDWPLIMARYEQGETLSSIARTYDCSPPAISYIVSRNRGKTAADAAPPPASEPQLIKAASHETTGDNSGAVEASAAEVNAAAPAPEGAPEQAPVETPKVGAETGASGPALLAKSASVNGAAGGGEERRKLHLSLNGNGHSNGNGGHVGNGVNGNGHAGNGHTNGHANGEARPAFTVPRSAQPQGNGQRPFQAPRQTPPFDADRNGRDLFTLPEGRPVAQQPRDDGIRKDSTTFIDQDLRSRVDGDIAAFLAAFDAALAADTQESRFGLREATDRLLRAGARTRIELERLEAKMPLPSRDGAAEAAPTAWRYR